MTNVNDSHEMMRKANNQIQPIGAIIARADLSDAIDTIQIIQTYWMIVDIRRKVLTLMMMQFDSEPL